MASPGHFALAVAATALVVASPAPTKPGTLPPYGPYFQVKRQWSYAFDYVATDVRFAGNLNLQVLAMTPKGTKLRIGLKPKDDHPAVIREVLIPTGADFTSPEYLLGPGNRLTAVVRREQGTNHVATEGVELDALRVLVDAKVGPHAAKIATWTAPTYGLVKQIISSTGPLDLGYPPGIAPLPAGKTNMTLELAFASPIAD